MKDLIHEFKKKYAEYMLSIDGINNGINLEFVFGDGSINSVVMLVGEAPGKDEVALKKPFVGQAGRILSKFLESVNIEREDVYITNAIKYRLSKEGKRPGTFVNRPAKLEEIELAKVFLLEEVDIVKPKIIVPMGNVPLKALFGKNMSIGENHGRIFEGIIKDTVVYPIYHPASLIYNRKLEKVYELDILHLRDIINETMHK
jgi:uracil-DNA glycosylase family 4